jgi:hypothetical protein
MLTETKVVHHLPSIVGAYSCKLPHSELPLVFRTEADAVANSWDFLSGYEFMEEPDGGFEWLPGHA